MDAALGLQKRNYDVETFTSHHSPSHRFEESRDGPYMHTHSDSRLLCCPICCPGTLNVTQVRSPKSLFGLFHILFAHFRQHYLVLHLPFVILSTNSSRLFRLSGCSYGLLLPLPRQIAGRRRVREYLDNNGCQELGSQDNLASSSAYTVYLCVTGRDSRPVKRIYSSLIRVYYKGLFVAIHLYRTEAESRLSRINVEKYKAQDTDADVADVVS